MAVLHPQPAGGPGAYPGDAVAPSGGASASWPPSGSTPKHGGTQEGPLQDQVCGTHMPPAQIASAPQPLASQGSFAAVQVPPVGHAAASFPQLCVAASHALPGSPSDAASSHEPAGKEHTKPSPQSELIWQAACHATMHALHVEPSSGAQAAAAPPTQRVPSPQSPSLVQGADSHAAARARACSVASSPAATTASAM